MLDGMTGNPILLLDGAPVLQGREPIERTLAAQTGLTGARLTWMPYRVLVSGDGEFGVTFGATLLEPRAGRAITGRYISAWRRTPGGAWRLAAWSTMGPGPLRPRSRKA